MANYKKKPKNNNPTVHKTHHRKLKTKQYKYNQNLGQTTYAQTINKNKYGSKQLTPATKPDSHGFRKAYI